MKVSKIVALLLVLGFVFGGLAAQALAPAGVEGQFIYVPFPAKITLDGKTDDWANITRHKLPNIYDRVGPAVPGENENPTWAMAADDQWIYVTGEVADKTIVAGKNGADWYKDDSFEFYVNYNDALTQTAYNKKCLQVRILGIDIGNKDPKNLKLVNAERFGIEGFVYKTDKGWGFEIKFPSDKRVKNEHGFTWGSQFQYNGTSAAGGRTVRITWSPDPKNESWQVPKVWGKAVQYKIGSTDEPKPSK